MKIKLNTLVAAVVLAASSMSANAIIDTNIDTGNSEVFFSAWDFQAGIGYTYDLNWNLLLNDLVGADQFATAAGNTALLANAKVQSSLIGTNGIIFDDVLTGFDTANFTNFADVEWNVGVFDVNGRNRLLITEGDTPSAPFATTTTNVRFVASTLAGYTGAASTFGDTTLTDTFAVTNDTNGNAWAGFVGSTYQGRIGDTTSILGDSANLVFLAQHTQTATLYGQAPLIQQLNAFDGRSIVAKTYLQDGAWRLQIAAVTVAAVPEPETYALLLAGLGFVGAIARRRSKAA